LLSQLFYRLFECICIKCALNALAGAGAEGSGLKIMDCCKTALKKRSTNFSAREETLLVELVRKYKNKIECKKSDTNTNKIKVQAWIDLSKGYNAISGDTYRDPKVLRSKYENLKKRTKQKLADEKASKFGTGGGPEEHFHMTEVDVNIKEIIGKQLNGFPSEFDNDCEEVGEYNK
jgi:hypothetical protein